MLDASLVQFPKDTRRFQQFIDGRWTAGASSAEIVRQSPAHGRDVTAILVGTALDVEAAVRAARIAFDDGRWSGLPSSARCKLLRRVADLIRRDAEDLAMLETLEVGKPITQSRGEVAGAADIWDYAAGMAQALHGDSHNNLGDGLFGMVLREPIGVVGIITPWNYPFFILAERLPFILASGCTAVIKPSEMTSATTLRIAELAAEAGVPAGVINVVTGTGPVVGQAIVDHPLVDMVSFTGSTNIGRSTMVNSARHIKKVSLELGGKNPQVVFADANLQAAADGLVYGMVANAGQTCVSGSRFIVHRDVAAELQKLLLAKIARITVGDTLDPAVKMGSIISPVQHAKVLGYIERAKSDGAELLCGGGANTELLLSVLPTLFAETRPEMQINREEVFGPVASLLTFETAEEAIALANDTEYGLSAGIWSTNLQNTLQAVRRIKAGRVWVNTFMAGGPEMPIGGFRQSGIGRESGIYGVEEYTEIKSVHIDMGARSPWLV
ncbi:aldehyde dehydrogenase family protein [Tabrizicola sp. KVB23]|uniref:Aldehyde dehydrogenase family protein n=2 Tax=Fuscibacter oryzae TaxID=2803939 RepID=A0A8J7MRY0_9RHOB|nr:aldehyde dehydrogenase family protein [Fuscibacter oryzae]MBL4929412.1 aldehyde dehydrogenase family protein [Fuscibacter oryzae]